MNYLLRLSLLLAMLLLPAYGIAAPAPDSGIVTIVIEPMFGDQPLQLSDKQYVDNFGDTLYIDLFRFYMTDLDFGSKADTTFVMAGYSHLVDAEDKNTLSFSVKIPAGTYSSFNFTAGVDSVDNTSGANGGDLDPAMGMYWAWNTGYIMAKLEGHSNVCKTLHHAFEFHIGGYMPPYNAARNIDLSLGKEITVGSATLNKIIIKADVSKWLTTASLAKVNSIVIPGKDAAAMADNYAKMYSLDGIRHFEYPVIKQ